MSKIIRNPDRFFNGSAQAKYIPEHIRLNRIVTPSHPEMDDRVPNPVKIPANTGNIQDNWMSFDGHVSESSEEDELHDELHDTEVSSHNFTEEKNVNIKSGEYILMVSAAVVCSGDLETIQDRINNIVCGNDSTFLGKELEPDDFVVLKRMNLSFGVSIG